MYLRERAVKEEMFPHPERRGDQSGQRGSLREHSDQFVEGKAERPQVVAPPGPPQRAGRIPGAGRRGRVLRLGFQSQTLTEDCGYSLRGPGCDTSQLREDGKKCGPAGEARRGGV